MSEIFLPSEAPGFAKACSTFNRDESCEPTWYVVGEDYDDVYAESKTLCLYTKGIDYDVNYSSEGEKYVGVVVKDVPVGQLTFEDTGVEFEKFDRKGLIEG